MYFPNIIFTGYVSVDLLGRVFSNFSLDENGKFGELGIQPSIYVLSVFTRLQIVESFTKTMVIMLSRKLGLSEREILTNF